MKSVRDGCSCHSGLREPVEQPLLEASMLLPTVKKECELSVLQAACVNTDSLITFAWIEYIS